MNGPLISERVKLATSRSELTCLTTAYRTCKTKPNYLITHVAHQPDPDWRNF
ncbi:hypothetical protein Hanom_Chr06g00486071 [Helianthus anomalus]